MGVFLSSKQSKARGLKCARQTGVAPWLEFYARRSSKITSRVDHEIVNAAMACGPPRGVLIFLSFSSRTPPSESAAPAVAQTPAAPAGRHFKFRLRALRRCRAKPSGR